MDILYFGFSGSDSLEAEAAMELLRLERFESIMFGCKLAIGLMRTDTGGVRYEVSLDVVMAADGTTLIGHGANESAEAAIRIAFDSAENQLETAIVRASRRS
ncbi:HPF/RaiA family ribosome-associated protein [Paraburkholderia azotifigens]|uniref:HPF/RaiA family ribosome-associated protein n=1 Tax=Paraburkholderia azotifigens TaxID=2057004 RepID=UPI00317D7F94